jgi:hypothetical protein
VRFRQVESLALSNLQELALDEPPARGVAKRLASRSIAMARGQGRKALTPDRAGQALSSDAANRPHIGKQVSARGMWMPICDPADVGFGAPSSCSFGGQAGRRMPGCGTPASHRADYTVLPASAPSHVDCF